MYKKESQWRWLVAGAMTGAVAMYFFDRRVQPAIDKVDDKTLEARVRFEFDRKVSHGKSIQVEAQTGVITLRGPVLEDEVPAILKCALAVKGVKDVVNQMDQHRTSDRASELQGEGNPYLQ